MYSYVTHMSFVCHSYIPVCHSYVTRILFLYTPMSFVCHSYVLVRHQYVTRMYAYVIRMSLACGFTMNQEKFAIDKHSNQYKVLITTFC